MLAHGALCGVSRLGFHILRHSFATHLAMGGMNATELSAMLGNHGFNRFPPCQAAWNCQSASVRASALSLPLVPRAR
jgi:hypothetical protein